MPIITEEDGRSFLAAHLKPDQLDQLLYDIDGHGPVVLNQKVVQFGSNFDIFLDKVSGKNMLKFYQN